MLLRLVVRTLIAWTSGSSGVSALAIKWPGKKPTILVYWPRCQNPIPRAHPVRNPFSIHSAYSFNRKSQKSRQNLEKIGKRARNSLQTKSRQLFRFEIRKEKRAFFRDEGGFGRARASRSNLILFFDHLAFNELFQSSRRTEIHGMAIDLWEAWTVDLQSVNRWTGSNPGPLFPLVRTLTTWPNCQGGRRAAGATILAFRFQITKSQPITGIELTTSHPLTKNPINLAQLIGQLID